MAKPPAKPAPADAPAPPPGLHADLRHALESRARLERLDDEIERTQSILERLKLQRFDEAEDIAAAARRLADSAGVPGVARWFAE